MMYKKLRAFFERLPIGFGAQAILYPIILFAALVYAQMDKTALSHALFVLVLLLPVGAIIQLVIAAFSIRAVVRVPEKTVEKRKLFPIFIGVTNRGPLVFAFVEAVLQLPNGRASNAKAERVMMSLLPFSSCRIERGIEFAYRGEYDVGVSCVYVYDLSRTLRLRIDLNATQRVFVLPRRLELLLPAAHGEEQGEISAIRNANGYAEAIDTRAYMLGDSLKRVHWKLTSKSEDIIVRDGEESRGAHVLVMCDLEPYYSGDASEDMPVPRQDAEMDARLAMADAIVETALAVALRELTVGNRVTLSWIEDGVPVYVRLDSVGDYEANFRRFAAAALDSTASHVMRAADAFADKDALPLIVCACLTKERTREYAARFSGEKCEARLLLCRDDELFVYGKAAQHALDTRVNMLIGAGIDVIKLKP